MCHPLEVTASISVPMSRIRQSHGLGDDIDGDDEEFVLSFDGLPELSNKTDLLEGVYKMLPISNLEFLSICAPSSLNWVKVFRRCTKLTTLQVIGPGTSSLVRALTTPKDTNARRSWNSQGADENPLRMLRIDDCAITPGDFHWDGKEAIFDDGDDFTLSSDFTLNSTGSDSGSDSD
ncbi:hypothetical protein BJV77DRAFT_995755 [Russula vinacea]|nr:hypothetical protein BJV77DRAFT_995755 [Russula vinacea]